MKNKIAIIMIAIIAISALSLTASAYAMPFMNLRTVLSTKITQSYVRVDGVVTGFGNAKAIGTMQAQSRTTVLNSTNVIQGYSCTAIWSTNTSRPISAVRARENFTYTFDTARLVDGNYSALDYNGYSFFMNGTWNVWQITETYTITTLSNGTITSVNSNQNSVPLANQEYGTLAVASGWSNYTIAINQVAPITGSVFAERTTSSMFNPFIVNNDGSTSTVTPADIKAVVSAYGSMPGWGNYDQRLDFCQHYKIDICDLATAAANLNSAQ